MRNIRAVVFDLDDTLIKSRLGGRRGAQRALQTAATYISKQLGKQGHHYSQRQLLRQLRPIENQMMARASYDRDLWWRTLLDQLGLKLPAPWIHKTTLLSWDAYAKGSPPFRETEPALRQLKQAGFKLAIVSDSDGTRGMKRKRIRRLPFSHYFEKIVVAGEDTPRVKPSKAPFLLVARKLGLRPQNCVYIGDNPRTDIAGAKAAGMTTILVWRGGPRKGHPTYTVRSLRELSRLLI